jgi:hypothetical protein
MATSVVNVAAGTTSAVFPVNSLVSVMAGPAVQGGTVLLEWAPTPSGPWTAWSSGTSSSTGSFRWGGPAGGVANTTSGYVRITAATQATNVAFMDMTNANTSLVSELGCMNAVTGSQNTTSEVVVGSIRVPPQFLLSNGLIRVKYSASFPNNVNAKTMQVRVNGLTGTLVHQSPALASGLNFNAVVDIGLRGDGQSIIGFGNGGTATTQGGLGFSTVAYPTLTRDYINNETEIVVTATKATGTDALLLEQFLVQLIV